MVSENLGEQELQELKDRNSRLLAQSKDDPSVRDQNIQVCQNFGFQGKGRGAVDEIRRFLTRAFIVLLNKNEIKGKRGTYAKVHPELPLNPVEWFSSRGFSLQGWPDGLAWEARSGWPWIVGQKPRLGQECGLTEHDLRDLLKDAQSHEVGISRLSSKASFNPGDGGLLTELEEHSGNITDRNIYELSICSKPGIYARNIEFCKANGFKKGNTNKGHGEIRSFISRAVVALIRNAGITTSKGGEYVSQPKGFLQHPEVWLACRGHETVGWPPGLPISEVSVWSGHIAFAFAVMLLKGAIHFKSIGQVLSPLQLEKRRKIVKKLMEKTAATTVVEPSRTRGEGTAVSRIATSAEQQVCAAPPSSLSDATSSSSDDDSDTDSEEDDSSCPSWANNAEVTAGARRSEMSKFKAIHSGSKSVLRPLAPSDVATTRLAAQISKFTAKSPIRKVSVAARVPIPSVISSPRLLLSSRLRSLPKMPEQTHRSIESPLKSLLARRANNAPPIKRRSSELESNDIVYMGTKRRRGSVDGRRNAAPLSRPRLEPSPRNQDGGVVKKVPVRARVDGRIGKSRYTPPCPPNLGCSWTKVQAYKHKLERNSASSSFPLPDGYTWPWDVGLAR